MFEGRKILFVENDGFEIRSKSRFLTALGADFHHALTVADALREWSHLPFDYLLTDTQFDERAGIERPKGQTFANSAYGKQSNISLAAAHAIPHKTSSDRWVNYAGQYPFGIVLGDREQRLAQFAAKKHASCVIIGETGTGKEEAAKLIHRLRCEVEGKIPFVAVNCATITGNLAESILFGHKRGAFTGADEATHGYIAEADGGILFLDEIQTLSIPVQQKLLRVLNDGTFNRLGETKTQRSRFQLVVASTQDLDQEVAEGRFLVDIQMRMMGLDFEIQPLRKRLDDIPPLVALFLSRKNVILEDDCFRDLVAKLQTFFWSGNIRQLFKSLEAWLLNCELDGLALTAANFPVFKDSRTPAVSSESTVPVVCSVEGEIDLNSLVNVDGDFDAIVSNFERLLLINAQKRHGSISSLSRAMNLPRSTLDARRRKHGLL